MTRVQFVGRTLHDLGAAAWFGGSLIGAVGVNGATSDAAASTDPGKLAADGWARSAPVFAVAIGAHLLGGLALVVGNAKRVVKQDGVARSTATKSAVTVAAIAATGYAGWLGTQIAAADQPETDGAVEPSADTPDDVASAQKQLRILQWVIPALTGTVVVLGADMGEQQRPGAVAVGISA
jgi:hypothetical protein